MPIDPKTAITTEINDEDNAINILLPKACHNFGERVNNSIYHLKEKLLNSYALVELKDKTISITIGR